jgi:Skp family chaperone for outer membrane proteins
MPATTLPARDDDNVVIDYLDEDPEIPTQKYCIVSFLSPEKIIKQKNEFMFQEFIKYMDYDWKVKGLEHLMVFLSKKYSLKVEDLLKDAADFVKVRNDEIRTTDVPEQWQVFLLKNEKDLQEKFDNSVEFRSNIRGVKVRRCFPTVEEAQIMAKVLQRKYPKDNLYIGKVGCWLPWDPSEHLMPEVEYAERELNELMRKYKENESNKEIFFADQREESIKRQKEENERRKKENELSAAAEREQREQRALEDASKPVHPSEGAIRE